jgi:hypothetical protein
VCVCVCVCVCVLLGPFRLMLPAYLRIDSRIWSRLKLGIATHKFKIT